MALLLQLLHTFIPFHFQKLADTSFPSSVLLPTYSKGLVYCLFGGFLVRVSTKTSKILHFPNVQNFFLLTLSLKFLYCTHSLFLHEKLRGACLFVCQYYKNPTQISSFLDTKQLLLFCSSAGSSRRDVQESCQIQMSFLFFFKSKEG